VDPIETSGPFQAIYESLQKLNQMGFARQDSEEEVKETKPNISEREEVEEEEYYET